MLVATNQLLARNFPCLGAVILSTRVVVWKLRQTPGDAR